MQDTIMKYAEILSEVLKVDVEILDYKLNRIAGTGEFEGKINNDISNEGHIYKRVIETGEKNVNRNPGKQEICIGCPHMNSCEEKFGMSTPIKMNNKVIGVIGFVCFTEKQKQHILRNLETFSKFSDQIADLIALKAKEEIEKNSMMDIMNLLIKTIDKMEEGVAIVDENNKLFKANHLAKNILKISKNEKELTVDLTATENYIFNKREYILNINGKSFMLIGDAYKIHLSDVQFYKIFIFNDLDTMKERLFTVTNTKENIGLDRILGENQKILDIKQKIKKVASSTSTVLITGESGTGKELFSRAFHMESDRVNQPFIAINCASIPDTLLESELFGYVKGAFTGADPKGKIGKIELAHGGTLFLDEIGDMPLYLQAKLLRVLEDRKVVRLGSNKVIDVDVRIIAATNKNLEKIIQEKTFREDLFYRLNVIPIYIPPLRDRKDDIQLLAEFFIKKYTKLFNKEIKHIDPKLIEYLLKYDWPGNVRELENAMEYMVNMIHNGIIDASLLPSKILNSSCINDHEFNLEKIEKETIQKALKTYGRDLESKKKISKKLGIGIATLYRKLEKYKLQ
ncbi:sigma 54-interacting transcriptional regulator [Clostridiaceae bacterium 35-E11]